MPLQIASCTVEGVRLLALITGLLLFLPTDAPAAPALYHERIEPPNPQGTVLLIHGGGWQWHGKAVTKTETGNAQRFSRYGWRTINVDYRPGRQALGDVIAWYDHIRLTYPGPIVAFGRSAGASLALMLASRRDVNAVIGEGAITDLTNIKGNHQAALLRRGFVAKAFGTRLATLRRNSPINHGVRNRAPVLLATSAGDRYADPRRQLEPYRRRHPTARVFSLPVGSREYVHRDVDPEALRQQHAREHALLQRVSSTS